MISNFPMILRASREVGGEVSANHPHRNNVSAVTERRHEAGIERRSWGSSVDANDWNQMVNESRWLQVPSSLSSRSQGKTVCSLISVDGRAVYSHGLAQFTSKGLRQLGLHCFLQESKSQPNEISLPEIHTALTQCFPITPGHSPDKSSSRQPATESTESSRQVTFLSTRNTALIRSSNSHVKKDTLGIARRPGGN